MSQRGTENNVDVFVNNVRQEPGVAYNIQGNGTSLVFTAAPSTGTNNIYVVNRGPAELSASHPASQNLEAADGTFTGDLTVDTNTLKVDSTNNIVLAGMSSSSGTADGLRVIPNDFLSFTTNVTDAGDRLILLNRQASEGNMIEFRQANSNIGMITLTGSNDMAMYSSSSNHVGVRLGEGYYIPTNNAGTVVDNAVDVGLAAYRYKDLYLGGGMYVGGTSSVHHLDDYEEGTWTPSYSSTGGSFSSITYNEQNGTYVKIGRLVVVSFDIRTNSVSLGTATGSLVLGGLPFTLNGTQATGQCGAQSGWTTNAPEYWNVSDGGTSGFLRRTNGAGYSDITVSNMSTGSNTGHNRILGCSIAYYTNS